MEKRKDLKDYGDYIFDWLAGDTPEIEEMDAVRQGRTKGRIETVLEALQGEGGVDIASRLSQVKVAGE